MTLVEPILFKSNPQFSPKEILGQCGFVNRAVNDALGDGRLVAVPEESEQIVHPFPLVDKVTVYEASGLAAENRFATVSTWSFFQLAFMLLSETKKDTFPLVSPSCKWKDKCRWADKENVLYMGREEGRIAVAFQQFDYKWPPGTIFLFRSL